MSDESTDLNAFEKRLTQVPPDPGRLQRDALLFAAGLAAGRRGRFWPTAAGGLALLCLGLCLTLVLRPPAVVEVECVVIVRLPAPEPEAPPSLQQERPPQSVVAVTPEWLEGIRLRERVLRDGLDAMTSSVWAAAPTPTTREIPGFSDLRLNASPSSGEPLP